MDIFPIRGADCRHAVTLKLFVLPLHAVWMYTELYVSTFNDENSLTSRLDVGLRLRIDFDVPEIENWY